VIQKVVGGIHVGKKKKKKGADMVAKHLVSSFIGSKGKDTKVQLCMKVVERWGP